MQGKQSMGKPFPSLLQLHSVSSAKWEHPYCICFISFKSELRLRLHEKNIHKRIKVSLKHLGLNNQMIQVSDM